MQFEILLVGDDDPPAKPKDEPRRSRSTSRYLPFRPGQQVSRRRPARYGAGHPCDDAIARKDHGNGFDSTLWGRGWAIDRCDRWPTMMWDWSSFISPQRQTETQTTSSSTDHPIYTALSLWQHSQYRRGPRSRGTPRRHMEQEQRRGRWTDMGELASRVGHAPSYRSQHTDHAVWI